MLSPVSPNVHSWFKMYIYDLPFHINEELCRLLDNDDYWKELAGNMSYSTFDINEIERESQRRLTSPTKILLVKWGQLNHNVTELFLLLYKMKHVPAMTCLKSVVPERCHKLLKKQIAAFSQAGSPKATVENGNPRKMHKGLKSGSEISYPLPVMCIVEGKELPSSSNVVRNDVSTDDSSVETTSTYESRPPLHRVDRDIMKNVTAIPHIRYEELREATNNWSDANLLGRGGFGQVYKGEWKHSNIAVKRLKENNANNRELISEMCSNKYRHDNILPLYGYSIGGDEPCLVYQLMMGGSLEQRLRLKSTHPPLSWSQRLRIAHGVARGLLFLHTMAGTPLIHGDIKPANILLDQCTIPKIGDFGLARQGPYGDDRADMKVSRVHGTRPYLPSEYIMLRCLSPAVDVFSFGVVLIELASSLRALDKSRPELYLSDHMHALNAKGVDFTQLEDPILKGTPKSNPGLCSTFIDIGLECTNPQRNDRPTMVTVYRHLDSIRIPNTEYVPI